MPVMVWMVMVVHVRWNWWLRIVMGMMIFLARTVLVRGVVMVGSKVVVRMLGLSVMPHVWVVVVIAIGSIIDGVIVVVSIIAWFVLHIPV